MADALHDHLGSIDIIVHVVGGWSAPAGVEIGRGHAAAAGVSSSGWSGVLKGVFLDNSVATRLHPTVHGHRDSANRRPILCVCESAYPL